MGKLLLNASSYNKCAIVLLRKKDTSFEVSFFLCMTQKKYIICIYTIIHRCYICYSTFNHYLKKNIAVYPTMVYNSRKTVSTVHYEFTGKHKKASYYSITKPSLKALYSSYFLMSAYIALKKAHITHSKELYAYFSCF